MLFTIGQQFKHYNGFVWVITDIAGKTIGLESTQDGYTIRGAMKAKDLQAVIKAGYYSPVNQVPPTRQNPSK